MPLLGRCCFLNLFSFCSQFLDDVVQPILIDGTEPFGGDLEGDPFVFFGEEEAFRLQVGQEPAFRLDVRVRNFVAGDRNFTRNLTYSSHDSENLDCKSRKILGINQKKSAFFAGFNLDPRRLGNYRGTLTAGSSFLVSNA